MPDNTATTSPADELRETARLMRQRAEAAAQPHHPYGDERLPLVETTEAWSAEVLNYLGGEMGEHCASMHPVVALAVADLLTVISWFPSIANPTDMHAALAVARAYLGTSVEAVARG